MTVERPLFQYSIVLGDHEFGIEITEQGMSTWHDRSFERTLVSQIALDGRRPKHLLRSLSYDANGFRDEPQVALQLARETMSFIEVAAEMFAREKWEPRHEVTLDRILEEVFWDQVNPRLRSPMRRPEVARTCGR